MKKLFKSAANNELLQVHWFVIVVFILRNNWSGYFWRSLAQWITIRTRRQTVEAYSFEEHGMRWYRSIYYRGQTLAHSCVFLERKYFVFLLFSFLGNCFFFFFKYYVFWKNKKKQRIHIQTTFKIANNTCFKYIIKNLNYY